ncbi:MAG TPA: Fmu (Sun) domain-containing protein [Chitinophagaceae bacterium]|jgi:16S rRNA (cytosine967-C5)-methyltransferase|nr:Fmu (Sun) domain-containing protein [Chitinophagaceae bacterium]
MGRYHSYLRTAEQLLVQYRGAGPFASFLKKFFGQHKKYGSTDRKQIAHLCYCYFRLGKAGLNLPIDERILLGLFLSSTESSELLEHLKPEWNQNSSLNTTDKISLIGHPFSISDIFPWEEDLSNGIEPEAFILSHLRQPDLFLRLRPGYEEVVKEKLQDAKTSFQIVGDACLALPNGTDIKNLIALDKEAVIQDYSSQRIKEFMQPDVLALDRTKTWKVWDCCAGSGGKTILLTDVHADNQLTLSDVRDSVFHKITERLGRAGIHDWQFLKEDLTKKPGEFIANYGGFHLIIADVPCTGSGTWSRTPECIQFFKKDTIKIFVEKQKKIISNVIPCLRKREGFFLYITCSVFKKENEGIAEFIKEKFHLELIRMELLKGYDKKADTLFVALLKYK